MIKLCSKESNNLKLYFLMSEDSEFISICFGSLEYLSRNVDNGSIRVQNNQSKYEIIAQYKDVREFTEKCTLDFPEKFIWLSYVHIFTNILMELL